MKPGDSVESMSAVRGRRATHTVQRLQDAPSTRFVVTDCGRFFERSQMFAGSTGHPCRQCLRAQQEAELVRRATVEASEFVDAREVLAGLEGVA